VRCILATLFLVTCFLSPAARAQCRYDLVLIPGPDCGIFGQAATIGYDISDAGDVVGDIACGFTNTAFRWYAKSGLQPLDLGTSGGSSWARGVNNAGVITGYYESSDESYVAGFIFDSGQVETIPPPTGGTRLRPNGISETGAIFGHWGNHITGPGLAAFRR